MLENVLRHLRNWFCRESRGGTYTIIGGKVDLPFLQQGQYFRVIGSVFNDGVHQYNDELSLTDETFYGEIWALAIPKALLYIVQDIEEWQTKNGAASAGIYQSESFGGYSYTLKADAASGSGDNSWMGAFSSRLSQWRKI